MVKSMCLLVCLFGLFVVVCVEAIVMITNVEAHSSLRKSLEICLQQDSRFELLNVYAALEMFLNITGVESVVILVIPSALLHNIALQCKTWCPSFPAKASSKEVGVAFR